MFYLRQWVVPTVLLRCMCVCVCMENGFLLLDLTDSVLSSSSSWICFLPHLLCLNLFLYIALYFSHFCNFLLSPSRFVFFSTLQNLPSCLIWTSWCRKWPQVCFSVTLCHKDMFDQQNVGHAVRQNSPSNIPIYKFVKQLFVLVHRGHSNLLITSPCDRAYQQITQLYTEWVPPHFFFLSTWYSPLGALFGMFWCDRHHIFPLSDFLWYLHLRAWTFHPCLLPS